MNGMSPSMVLVLTLPWHSWAVYDMTFLLAGVLTLKQKLQKGGKL